MQGPFVRSEMKMEFDWTFQIFFIINYVQENIVYANVAYVFKVKVEVCEEKTVAFLCSFQGSVL